MSDGASLEDFSLKVYHHKIMVASRAARSADNHSGLRSALSYNNVTNEAFVSGIHLDAASVLTGGPASAGGECPGATGGPFGSGPVAYRSACLAAAAVRIRGSCFDEKELRQYVQAVNLWGRP